MEEELPEPETMEETCENTEEENTLEQSPLLTVNRNVQQDLEEDHELLDLSHNNLYTAIRTHSILMKKRILIGCTITLLLVIILIIILIKTANRSSSNIYQSSTISYTTTSTTTTSDTIASATIPNPLPTTSTESLTFSSKSCLIPAVNARWNTSPIVFINQHNRCLSNEYELCEPSDLFIDNIHDTLYIVDTNNNRILKFFLNEIYDTEVGATGITVAKNLFSPKSIFVDTHTEDMYIIDFDQEGARRLKYGVSYRVHLWKKNENVGRVLIIEEGEYLFGQSRPHITLDKQMNIYIGTRFYIRKWLASTDYTEKIFVAGKNQQNPKQLTDLFDPNAFVITDDLTLYIADWNNKRIQKWTVNATAGTTVIGNLTYVVGITMDCNGYLYYVDTYDYTITQLNMMTNQKRIIGGFQDDLKRSIFHSPSAIRIDKFGNLFFLDRNQVYKFSII